MKILYFPILIFLLVLLPEFSFTLHCTYNNTAWGLRNTVLLEFEHNKYIHVHDFSMEILFAKNDRFKVLDIHFKGYIMQEEKSKYVDVLMDNMKLYVNSNRDKNGCTVTFYESADDTLMIDSNNTRVILSKAEKAIILRLAESCVRSDLCDVNALKVDRDGDLSFESVQSTINFFVDMAIPSILSMFILDQGGLQLSLNGTLIYESLLANVRLNDILVEGIDQIQRTDDVYIANENNVYTVQFGFRFPKLTISSQNIEFWKGKSNIATIDVYGFSFSNTITVDFESTNCSIKLTDFHIISYKNVEISLKLGGVIPVNYSGDRSTFKNIEKDGMKAANEFARKQIIDCQQYLKQLSDVFKKLL